MIRRRSGIALAGILWVLAAGGAHAASIDIGSASGMPGDDLTVDVTLRTMGATVLGTQNRIDFDRETPIAARPTGDPDCAVNAAIDKGATNFRFQPLGCDPAADCRSVRVFVLALDNLDPIPDTSVLYTCRIAIAADAAAGSHALRNAEALASAPGGQAVPTTGSDGVVEVVPKPAASVDVGSASAPAGTATTFAVTVRLLTAPPATVAGVLHDIGFDPLTPIAATDSGRPACTADEVIAKNFTSFTFLPMGCTARDDCTGMRALVLPSGDTPGGIPDGATLYSCQVAIAGDAPLGTYPLVAGMPLASGPDGEGLPVLASDGAIEVIEAPAPACVGDCDGDHAVAINELLLGVNIVISAAQVSACPLLDANGDGSVAVNELVQAVNTALRGCPGT